MIVTAPGPFRTRVVTPDVDPRLVCYHKSARLKQYFKEHRALRTELVISDTRDFGIGLRVTYDNWNALRIAGDHANQRLCDAETADAMPAPDVATLDQVTRPTRTGESQHAPAGRAIAFLFTKAYGRVLSPGLTLLDPQLPDGLASRSPLGLAWKNLTVTLDHFIDHGLAPALRPKLDPTRNSVMA